MLTIREEKVYLFLGAFPSFASVNSVLKVVPSSPVPRSYAVRIIQTGFCHLEETKTNCLLYVTDYFRVEVTLVGPMSNFHSWIAFFFPSTWTTMGPEAM